MADNKHPNTLPPDSVILTEIVQYTGHDDFRISLNEEQAKFLLPIVKEKLHTLGGLTDKRSTGIREALAHALMSRRWLERSAA
jgi:hypothetical protein